MRTIVNQLHSKKVLMRVETQEEINAMTSLLYNSKLLSFRDAAKKTYVSGCVWCGKWISNTDALFNHFRKEHWDVCIWCVRCGCGYDNPNLLSSHCVSNGQGRARFAAERGLNRASFGPNPPASANLYLDPKRTLEQDERELSSHPEMPIA
jgi:hypothetical protein